MRLAQPAAPAGAADEARAEALLLDAAATALRYLVPSPCSEALHFKELRRSAPRIAVSSADANSIVQTGALALGTTIGERAALGEVLLQLEALARSRLAACATELGHARGGLRLRQWAAIAQVCAYARYDPVRAELFPRQPDEAVARARGLVDAAISDAVTAALDGAELESADRAAADFSASSRADAAELLLAVTSHAASATQRTARRLLDGLAPVFAAPPKKSAVAASRHDPLAGALAAAADDFGRVGGGGGLCGGPYELGARVHAAVCARLRERLRLLRAALGEDEVERTRVSRRMCEAYADALGLEAELRARVEPAAKPAAAAAAVALLAELRALFAPHVRALADGSLAELRMWARRAALSEPFGAQAKPRPRSRRMVPRADSGGAAAAAVDGPGGAVAAVARAAMAAAALARRDSMGDLAADGSGSACACVGDMGVWCAPLLLPLEIM
ncbi:hypothetical protein T492DRAFT_919344 [Pavlovales sp. CCMP2436]|nr:hypothetical protein T492DRAFT_919344 [Pavlovales sp. CCMP2436]